MVEKRDVGNGWRHHHEKHAFVLGRLRHRRQATNQIMKLSGSGVILCYLFTDCQIFYFALLCLLCVKKIFFQDFVS